MVWIFVMKSRDTWGGRSPDSWLIHDHQFFLKGKVLTYSPQLPYWDIRVSQTTFTQLGQLWRNERIMPAPRRSPIQICLMYACDLSEICRGYAWDMSWIYHKYGLRSAWDMPNICMKCAWDLPEICLIYEICKSYAWNVPEICTYYAWNMA